MSVDLPPPGERLAKILRAERGRGLGDQLVFGGIDALLKNLLAQSTPQSEGPVLAAVQCLGGKSYAALDHPGRDAWIGRVLAIIDPPAGSPLHAPGALQATAQPVPSPSARHPPPSDGTVSPARSPSISRVSSFSAPTTSEPAATPRAASQPAHTAAERTPATAATTPPPPTAHLPLPARPAHPARQRSSTPLALDSPVTRLPGVGGTRAAVLARLGIGRVRDLLFHFPHRHDDFSQIVPISQLVEGAQQTVVARVWSATAVQRGKSFNRKSSEMVVGDETGNLRVIFFNNPYPAQQVRTNMQITLSGRISVWNGRPQLENPEWEIIEAGSDFEDAVHTGRLVPVYPLTQGIQNRALRSLVRAALDACGDDLPDPLPDAVRTAHGFLSLREAVRQIHYPDDAERLEQARRRLAYDELFELQVAVLARRARRVQTVHATPLPFSEERLRAYEHALPFTLTGAQRRTIDSVLTDIAGGTPMARLLQGDVGSGKTVVAAAALLAAVASGAQAVLMAPTEILAEQHFRTLRRLLGTDGAPDDGAVMFETDLRWLGTGRPLRVAMLRGSLKAAAKRAAQEAIAAGIVDIAVGTQALIQQSVSFERLALTVVDEQHRFGVLQRSALAEKGENAHVLVMTATPIPRTLQLSLYGDLDVSVIDELPPGRKRVRTKVLQPLERDFAYRFVREQVEQGFQAFIVCPLVEESEALEARAATEEYERLRGEVYPDVAMGLLHGRMKPDEKDAVMQAFRDRETSILVATSVIEVGIDIPKATVIMIEGADRFGLAQLHQFRGRVGRDGDQAFCLLLSESASLDAQTRLKLLETIDDGFKLAEADLRLRGSGDFFGTRQSGMPTLRVARITDTPILEAAREDARRIIDRDPLLESPDHAEIRARAERRSATAGEAN